MKWRQWTKPIAMLAVVLFASLLWGSDAHAQAEQAVVRYNNLLDAFENAAAMWNAPLVTLGHSLFWGLATIEVCWVGFQLALKGADLSEISMEMVKLILFLGFFWALVLHGPAWSNAIIQSFQQAGNVAVGASGGTQNINPSGILALGLKTSLIIMDQSSIWSPGDSLGLFIGALVIMGCFAFIAAYMAVTLLESYIVIGASVLFYAFGGSRWSSDIARRVFMYAISVGSKLFLLQLVAGTAYVLVQSWAVNYKNDNGTLLGLIGLALMLALVAAMLPSMIQAVISGSTQSSLGPAMMVAGAAMGAAAAATSAAVGAGSALSAASTLADSQLAGMAGGAGGAAGTAASSLGGGASAGSAMGGLGGGGGAMGGGSISGAGGGSNLGGPMSGRTANAGGGAGAASTGFGGGAPGAPGGASRATAATSDTSSGGAESGGASGAGAAAGGDSGSGGGAGSSAAFAGGGSTGAGASSGSGAGSGGGAGSSAAFAGAGDDSAGSATGSVSTEDGGVGMGGMGAMGGAGGGAGDSGSGDLATQSNGSLAPQSGGGIAATSGGQMTMAPDADFSDQGGAAAGGKAGGGLPSKASLVMRNLARAAGKEAMAHVSGQRKYDKARHSGFRMAEDMRAQASNLEKPRPPSDPPFPPDANS
jgi:type IV secretion system protein TrbL